MPRENIAQRRIKRLFELADQVYVEHPDWARRYVDIVRRISMRNREKIPTHLKRRICRGCKGYLKQGANCRIRVRQKREPHVTITCLDCGHITRIPIRRRKYAPQPD